MPLDCFDVPSELYPYLHGTCHVFALALQRVYGYPLMALQDLDHYVEYRDGRWAGPWIVHVLCTSPDERWVVDAAGVRRMARCRENVAGKHLRRCRITERAIKRWVKVSYPPYTEQDVRRAEALIRKDPKRYSLNGMPK